LLGVEAGVADLVRYRLLPGAYIVCFLLELTADCLEFGGKFKTSTPGQAKASLSLGA